MEAAAATLGEYSRAGVQSMSLTQTHAAGPAHLNDVRQVLHLGTALFCQLIAVHHHVTDLLAQCDGGWWRRRHVCAPAAHTARQTPRQPTHAVDFNSVSSRSQWQTKAAREKGEREKRGERGREEGEGGCHLGMRTHAPTHCTHLERRQGHPPPRAPGTATPHWADPRPQQPRRRRRGFLEATPPRAPPRPQGQRLRWPRPRTCSRRLLPTRFPRGPARGPPAGRAKGRRPAPRLRGHRRKRRAPHER
jgi:hypothetical protein